MKEFKQIIEHSMTEIPSYHSVLLVEDDKRLAALIAEYLQQQGLRVEIEHQGDAAIQRILTENPDLVILDWMLPGLNGLEVCRQVRPHYLNPILMLSAKDDDVDQIVGLELGADDYMVKPVQPRMLLARIRALLRRIALYPVITQQKSELQFGKLCIHPHSRQVILSNTPLELTTQEYDFIYLFATNAGIVLSRDTILAAINGIEYDGLDRSVDIRISRLRKILETDPSNPTGIKTVRGQGYLFVADGWN